MQKFSVRYRDIIIFDDVLPSSLQNIKEKIFVSFFIKQEWFQKLGLDPGKNVLSLSLYVKEVLTQSIW